MKFGTHLEDTVRKIFGYRVITHSSRNKNGSRFHNGRHPLLFLLTHQVKNNLESSFWWQSYTSKDGKCSGTFYNKLATTKIAFREQKLNTCISVQMFASSENMIHRSGKRQCTEVMPWHICTFLCCTPSYTHT